jgi:hypothetical protein
MGSLLVLLAKLEAIVPLLSRIIDLLVKARDRAREKANLDRKAGADAKLQHDLEDIHKDQTVR